MAKQRHKKKKGNRPGPAGDVSAPANDAAPPRRLSRRRRWTFRLITATVLPALFLLALEGGLRLFGYGHATSFTLKEKINGTLCHVPNHAFGFRFFPREVAREALWFAYPVEKPPNTVRIFILGGSAAQGDPDGVYGLARMLSVMLRQRYPDTQFEVINAAMTAINSHVVREIVEDVASHDPDLLILYLGNNEVVGPFGAGNSIVPLSDRMGAIRTKLFLKETRVGQLAEAVVRTLSPDTAATTSWRGMAMFLENEVRLGDEKLLSVYRHFRTNLRHILAKARRADIPVVLSTVGVNLRDCAPFASLHRSDLKAENLSAWTRLYEEGVNQEREGNGKAAVDAFQACEQLDADYADLYYRLGHCYLALDNPIEAKRHFERARDLDTLRFRADSTINNVIRETAAQAGGDVSFVDAARLYEADSLPEGIPGEPIFFEHVHMTFHGNYLLARYLLANAEKQLRAEIGDPVDPVPNEAECLEQLALTDFDRLSVLKLVAAKLEQAPFTGQLDIKEHLSRKHLQVRRLEQALTEESINAGKGLYKEALAKTPDDGWLHLRHGRFLLNASGDAAAAETAYRSALRTGMRETEIWEGLGAACYRQGRLTDAVAAYREGLAIQPRHWRILSTLGFTLNLCGDPEQAISDCTRAVELALWSADAQTNLGLVLMAQGDFERAFVCFQKSIELGGESSSRCVNLGLIFAQKGMPSKAAACYVKAHELDENDYRANRELGLIRQEARDFAAAIRHFELAHEARPGDGQSANNLAWLLATTPEGGLRDGSRAVELALVACQAVGKDDPAVLDTLAAAYAETGQFEQAVSTAKKALAQKTVPALKQQIQTRLRLYRDGLPFRETPY